MTSSLPLGQHNVNKFLNPSIHHKEYLVSRFKSKKNTAKRSIWIEHSRTFIQLYFICRESEPIAASFRVASFPRRGMCMYFETWNRFRLLSCPIAILCCERAILSSTSSRTRARLEPYPERKATEPIVLSNYRPKRDFDAMSLHRRHYLGTVFAQSAQGRELMRSRDITCD